MLDTPAFPPKPPAPAIPVAAADAGVSCIVAENRPETGRKVGTMPISSTVAAPTAPRESLRHLGGASAAVVADRDNCPARRILGSADITERIVPDGPGYYIYVKNHIKFNEWDDPL
jgi:hypothetical protein